MDFSTGFNTPTKARNSSPAKKQPAVLEYDSDIDPDDLLPVYLDTKAKLFHLQEPQKPKKGPARPNGALATPSKSAGSSDQPEAAKLIRKMRRIEDDVLFDRYIADQHWETRRIQLEKDAATDRRALEAIQDSSEDSQTLVDSDDEVSREAAKIGAAMLEETGSDDDIALSELFASLPVDEVDPVTGKSSTVINGKDGVKVTIQDFGKWTGVSPTRVLEEACKARQVHSSYDHYFC